MASSPSAAPSWAELPRDITAAILLKLGAIEMLNTAQKVCTAWRSVCQDPSMWRHIDMHNLGYRRRIPSTVDRCKLEKMCRYAVDRSQGQLIGIDIEYFGTDELLHHISQSCTQLRSLQLVVCHDISSEALIEAVKKFPLLEEMRLSYLKIDTVKVIEAIGKSCPQLKSFALNDQWCTHSFIRGFQLDPLNAEAQAIAINMPQVRHLQLFGNRMSNDGLQAILKSCPILESLDLRHCFCIQLSGKIGQKFRRRYTRRIKDLRHPDDSMDDCSFQTVVKHLMLTM